MTRCIHPHPGGYGEGVLLIESYELFISAAGRDVVDFVPHAFPVLPQCFLGYLRISQDTWDYPGMSLVRVTYCMDTGSGRTRVF